MREHIISIIFFLTCVRLNVFFVLIYDGDRVCLSMINFKVVKHEIICALNIYIWVCKNKSCVCSKNVRKIFLVRDSSALLGNHKR